VATRVIRDGVRPGGLVRLWRALINSSRGIANCYRSEAAFRQEIWGLVVVVPLAIALGETGVERALLLGSYLVLLIVELLNTGIEVVVDRIGPERHALSGFAKDLGSAAVLLAIVLVAMSWILVILA
jgi:diacylglycerol kinase (ATP)